MPWGAGILTATYIRAPQASPCAMISGNLKPDFHLTSLSLTSMCKMDTKAFFFKAKDLYDKVPSKSGSGRERKRTKIQELQ